jgi:hypothetical protein
MRTAGTTALLVAFAAALVLAAGAGAARQGVICKTFKSNGVTFYSQTVGSWSCSSAQTWIKKLSRDRVGKVTKSVPLRNGPSGLHCFALPLSSGGRATGGACVKGTLAFPKLGFTWYPK